jgi:hypothetical protein
MPQWKSRLARDMWRRASLFDKISMYLFLLLFYTTYFFQAPQFRYQIEKKRFLGSYEGASRETHAAELG